MSHKGILWLPICTCLTILLLSRVTSHRLPEQKSTVMTTTRIRIIPCLLVLLVAFALDAAAVPALISYQGRLTNVADQPVPDGEHQVSFVLYDDSIDGTPVWAEAATVSTSDGLFTHLMGSVTPLPGETWLDREALWLELIVDGEPIAPRTRIVTVPYAAVAEHLELRDDTTRLMYTGIDDSGMAKLTVRRPEADSMDIVISGSLHGDTAVILPDSSIGRDEILDEPGMSVGLNVNTVELVDMEMTDMVTVNIGIPTDGYIVLDGKCYVVLEGTTGPNVALIQIDEEEGGTSQFPYYTLAGLDGYATSGEHFFPIYVTRIYYREAGQYTFRMEGRASYPPPAEVRTWDHVLKATFIPSDYGFVGKVTMDPAGYSSPRPLQGLERWEFDPPGPYYEVDLRDAAGSGRSGPRPTNATD